MMNNDWDNTEMTKRMGKVHFFMLMEVDMRQTVQIYSDIFYCLGQYIARYSDGNL